jgi:SAM-dependent methyltransferase
MDVPCTDPDFWNVRYRAGRTPWDQGGVPPALERFLTRTAISRPTRPPSVLIPGCGTGHEIAAFARAGYRVTAIDFSPAAVARARANLPPELSGWVMEGDFFTAALDETPFDLIYERTFLCALAPERWPDVTKRLAGLLARHGTVAGLYFFGDKEDGPPFGLDPAEPAALFDPHFEVCRDEPVPGGESLPLFVGRERWQERRKRAT